MKLLPGPIRTHLLRNGEIAARARNRSNGEPDFIPVVKLFTPDAACTWLLTQLDPREPDVAYGLCDLGLGCPELGDVRVSELETVRGRLGLPVERDEHFRASYTIRVYARAAQSAARITECERALAQAASGIEAKKQSVP